MVRPVMPPLAPLLRQIWAKTPWTYLALGAVALLFAFMGGWREALIFDRAAIAQGEWWRLWTGHLIHFGWPHFLIDTGLFLILGWLLEREYPVFSRVSLVVLPALISAGIYWWDPAMLRYAGLSAFNLGLLVFLAMHGWQRAWTDWFWPAVLAIYIGELVLEATVGHGTGGGMIQFDDPSVHVATSAHIVGGVYGITMAIVIVRWRRARGRPA